MPLEVVAHDEVARYVERVRPVLRRDEARNNLPLGVLWQLEHSDIYDEWHLFTVEERDEIVGVFLRTPPWPWNVTVAGDRDPVEVSAVVADHLAVTGAEPAEVNGAAGVAELVAHGWAEAIGGLADQQMAMRVMSCEEVQMPPAPTGRRRRATVGDVELVRDWLVLFQGEVFDREVEDIDGLEDRIRRSLSEDQHGTWLWEDDDQVVSLTAIGRPTGTGERIAPVFTPAAHRGRGYAGRLVAEVTADGFDRGLSHVFLFTDAANPVSNALYERLGYHVVGDAAIWSVSTVASGTSR
ncbi:MAG: GNAT family N-acetyltransferase [Nitriliruptorales bacterium]|nr:GNAT family N-acetyltransferase [Nitriliruptorales bacterium]